MNNILSLFILDIKMDLSCSFYDLISYKEPFNRPIRDYRKNYHLAYHKWIHCYEIFGVLISDLNNQRIDKSTFLTCMREIGLFSHEISGTHERDSYESQLFLQNNMQYLYDTPILLEMFFPADKRMPKRQIPRIFQAINFWTDGSMQKVDGETFRYFSSLFPHKELIPNPTSLADLPVNIYRFYEIIAGYEPIEYKDILFNDDFIFSFYLLIWPVIKRTGYAVKNLWMFVDQIRDVLNKFTIDDYVIINCEGSEDPYFCGRAFTIITAPDIYISKFVIFDTIPPMDMSPIKLSRYKHGL